MSDASTRKAIFITGGGSGIGRAVAQHFAAQGWFVGLADINEQGLAETAAMLPAGQSSTHLLDVRDRDQWREVLKAFASASGDRMDVLFNNAGIGLGGHFPDVDFEGIDRLIAINLTGVINGIHISLPMLKATPGSCILSTGSAAGIYGSAGLAVYSATKFGVRALTEALDIEFRPLGIRVRSIMPSFIDTPLLNQTVAGSNSTSRERVQAAGLEFTPVEEVAQKAWNAVHGKKVHTIIGKTSKKLAFAAKWMPWKIAQQRLKMEESSRRT